MTGLFRGEITEDGRLISRESDYTIDGIPLRSLRFFEIEVGEDEPTPGPANDNALTVEEAA